MEGWGRTVGDVGVGGITVGIGRRCCVRDNIQDDEGDNIVDDGDNIVDVDNIVVG